MVRIIIKRRLKRILLLAQIKRPDTKRREGYGIAAPSLEQ
jgi:hypothetical protein